MEKQRKFSLITILAISAVMVLLTYFNTQIFMSVEPYSPLGYEPDGIQLLAPGTIGFIFFMLLWVSVWVIKDWVNLPKNTGKAVFIFALLGGIPTWANIFPYIWMPNIIFFGYGVGYAALSIMFLVRFLFLSFKPVAS